MDQSVVLRIANFFESLNILLEINSLSQKLILRYFGPAARFYGGTFQDLIATERKRRSPSLYSGFEKIATLAKEAGIEAESSGFWELRQK